MTKLEELLMLLLHLMMELGGLIVTSGEFLNVSCSWFDGVFVYISKTMLTDICGYMQVSRSLGHKRNGGYLVCFYIS